MTYCLCVWSQGISQGVPEAPQTLLETGTTTMHAQPTGSTLCLKTNTKMSI